ncbi:MAG: hypothetical protein H7249_07315 [Chitinophagaceae bacterium]|nr:hypothetical protein [Oligoflexus sp.]
MISYLGVTVDELVQIFESSFSFSDDREGRIYEEAYHLEEIIIDDEVLAADLAEADALDQADMDDEDFDSEDFEDDDEDDFVDVFVDDDGRLHSLGESLPFAAEAVVGFLTDYIIADDIDEEWLTLDQARGALLALRISLPTLEEVPDVACAYSFKIARDSDTSLPQFVTMKALSPETLLLDSLTRTETHYEGVVSDETSLDDLFASVGVPEAERFALGDAISEGVFHLADEQCGIAFDVKKFRRDLHKQATKHKVRVVKDDGLDGGLKH